MDAGGRQDQWSPGLNCADRLTSGFTLLEALAVGAKWYNLKGDNVKKCIRIEITVLQIVIWGSKL